MKIYQVDAFTDHIFGGNPAAICPLDNWMPEGKMQQIAMENNLSETAFFVKENDLFHIRWFTPEIEIDRVEYDTVYNTGYDHGVRLYFTEQKLKGLQKET